MMSSNSNRESERGQQTTCAFVMWWDLKEKKKTTKDSPVQFYDVHIETLLYRRDTKQSGQKAILPEYCIYPGITTLEKVWTDREKLKGPKLIRVCLTHNLKTESKVWYEDLPCSKLSQSTYNVRSLSSACLISLRLIVSLRSNMHCCAVGQGLKHQEKARKLSEDMYETITVTEEILSTPWISFPMPPAKLEAESR